MAICKYCGSESGFLKSKHTECELKYNDGYNKIIEITKISITSNTISKEQWNKLLQIAKSSNILKKDLKTAILLGWSKTVENILEDGVLSEEEEKGVELFKEFYKFSQDDLNYDGSYSKIAQLCILRDIMEGKIPNRIKVNGQVPFNLLKDEYLIWLYNDTNYYQEKTRTHYAGSSQGISIRLAKGLYYRVGAFRGNPVKTNQIELVDTGLLGITDKHIYFTGKRSSFRLKYSKIISFIPYDDGIGLFKDTASSKQQIFITNDGWFTYNLIINLSGQNTAMHEVEPYPAISS